MIDRFIAGLLALVVVLPPSPALADATQRLQEFVAQTKTLSGRFSQVVVDRNGRKTQASQGSFSIARPGKFRWSYESPYAQLIVGDGSKVWIYDADLEQATVRKADRAMGESPAALLAGSNDIEQFFILKDAGTKDGLEWLEAVPKGREGSFETVRMGFKGATLQAMELRDAFGQKTRLDFNELRNNPRIKPEIFRFVPPKGVDVMGDE